MQVQQSAHTYTGIVLAGDKTGRTIGFPTVNLDVSLIPAQTEPGVYAAKVFVNTQPYAGALYFGPRLVKGETHNVLEIFILDFNQEIYGQEITFSLQKFIRPVLNFKSLDELQQQLTQDIAAVRAVAQSN